MLVKKSIMPFLVLQSVFEKQRPSRSIRVYIEYFFMLLKEYRPTSRNLIKNTNSLTFKIIH